MSVAPLITFKAGLCDLDVSVRGWTGLPSLIDQRRNQQAKLDPNLHLDMSTYIPKKTSCISAGGRGPHPSTILKLI